MQDFSLFYAGLLFLSLRQRSAVGGIMFSGCSCVVSSARAFQTLLMLNSIGQRLQTKNGHHNFAKLSALLHFRTRMKAIGVGDGGRGALAPSPQKKIGKKYFFREKSCKIWAFCYFFMHIFSDKNVLPPKLTELLRLYR